MRPRAIMGFGKTGMHAETTRLELGREVASPHPAIGSRAPAGPSLPKASRIAATEARPALEPAARCGEANPAVMIAGARASVEKPRGGATT
jgi:hypothetical protein